MLTVAVASVEAHWSRFEGGAVGMTTAAIGDTMVKNKMTDKREG